ncbi:Protein JINGUBANG [Camellia lanceoleosa]|uniref:Protein JINGUBANG n=1 Tax=Camellia lanceoleosa TaxID=1840588 RepID=A0ACC0FL20_9ERIC|nr:Protein JINGUBANG [Camellia lanceoleosa]
MEHYGKRNLCSFINEERKAIQSPTHLSFKTLQEMSEQGIHCSPTRPSTPSTTTSMYSLMPPPSPDSPWTLSPLQTPSPSLLHHCIASLHRHDGNIYSIAASRGLIFTGSTSSRIRVGLREVRAMLAYGNMLFTSHKDYKVRVKKSEPYLEKAHFYCFLGLGNQHKDRVSCMAYYHAEDFIHRVMGQTVKVWRISTAAVNSFVAHDDNVNAIVVNQEDGCVFTCSSMVQ